MTRPKHFLAFSLVAALALWGAGCKPTPPVPPAAGSGTTDDAHARSHGEEGHGHEGHDHAHDHAHGPHVGHIIEIGEEEYHAEWTHDKDGKVTVWILDAEMKKEVPIAADHITIHTSVAGKPSSYDLEAVERSEGDMPMTAKFEATDKNLEGVLSALSEGVTATLKADINGKEFEAPITHDDHGHKH
jgi:hypothetical protein